MVRTIALGIYLRRTCRCHASAGPFWFSGLVRNLVPRCATRLSPRGLRAWAKGV